MNHWREGGALGGRYLRKCGGSAQGYLPSKTHATGEDSDVHAEDELEEIEEEMT